MREPLDASPTQAISSHVRMIVGASDVLEYQQLLQELAHRFGQPAAMHGVEHFLRGAGRGMTPYLLFVLADPHAPIPLTPDNILGAALLHEFCLLGIGSGIFVSEGKDGLRSIIAPSDSRALIAATSASALLDHKGQVIVASYIQTTHSALAAPQALRWRSFHWATASRSAPGYLPLRETLDLTLQSLNKKTRFNFRYYRRLLEAETPLEFVADAGALLSLPQLQALNRRALGPVSEQIIVQRHATFAHQQGAYLCGLRTQAGEWLALIGGWRQQGTTVLQWQINLTGYERFSLVTVARSFWMEHEIALGSKVLRIDGGTTHAMNHSFVPENAVDLMLHRRSLRALAMVKWVAPFLAGRKLAVAKNNFLAKTLSQPHLTWHQLSPVTAGEVAPEPQFTRGPTSSEI
jgi:hypothetical protein